MTQIAARPDVAQERYKELGVVQVPQLLRPAEIDEIRTVFTSTVEADAAFGFDDHLPDGDILRRYPRFVHPHRRPETAAGRLARTMMLDRRLVDIVEELIGPAYGAQSMFYFKPPTARGQALHQDNMFLQAHPETCLAAWIAIDDCDEENGGLRVVPGSHRNELLCLEDADPAQSFATKQVPVPGDVEIVQTRMRAGDVLFFHGSLVHGSRPNTSADRFRRSLIFHYIPQTSREVAQFYHPLVTLDGGEASIGISAEGGSCGEGWAYTGGAASRG